MGTYLLMKVPRDTQGMHLLLSAEIEDVITHESTPVDRLRRACEREPGELFYLVQAVTYAIGVAKVEVVRTEVSP